MRLLVAEADLKGSDTVLEVGPGVGNLTELLLAQAGWVVAVEVDPALAEMVRERLGGAANMDLLVTDILADKRHIAPAVLEAIESRQRTLGGAVKLVANLPYAAATPLVAELVMCRPPPEQLVFTVQQEVAARLAAEPGTREYGAVGVLVQALADVEVLRRLAPSVFWPRPQVWSAMVRVTPRAAKQQRIRNMAAFHKTVEGLFAHRRKRAARSLALYASEKGDSPLFGRGQSPFSSEEWTARLAAAGLDSQARGETYSVEEIIRLANHVAGISSG